MLDFFIVVCCFRQLATAGEKTHADMTGETCTSTFCANIKHMNIKQHTVLVAMVGALTNERSAAIKEK
jgi:hypothetical protein